MDASCIQTTLGTYIHETSIITTGYVSCNTAINTNDPQKLTTLVKCPLSTHAFPTISSHRARTCEICVSQGTFFLHGSVRSKAFHIRLLTTKLRESWVQCIIGSLCRIPGGKSSPNLCMANIDPAPTLSDQDSLFDISESLVPIRELKQPGITSVSFDGLLKDPLLLKEDLKKGCGGQLWPAGILLAKYMLREHRMDLLGKTMSVCTFPVVLPNILILQP